MREWEALLDPPRALREAARKLGVWTVLANCTVKGSPLVTTREELENGD